MPRRVQTVVRSRSRSRVRRAKSVPAPRNHVPRAVPREAPKPKPIPLPRVPQRSSGPLVVKCFFCNERNFGDQLTLPVLTALARQWTLPLTFVAHAEAATSDLIGIGSILTSVPSYYSGLI